MLGNSHVRFGERDGETCLGDGVKRLVPTPPATMGFAQGVIDEVLDGLAKNGEGNNGKVEKAVAAQVKKLTAKFPIY